MSLPDTIPARFFDRARILGDAPALHQKIGGIWVPTSWRDFASQVMATAKAILALTGGSELGGNVSILGFNRPDWLVMAHAAMAVGGAAAGIYTTSSAEEIRYIVDHAESKIVLVENVAQWKKIQQIRSRLPKLQWVVFMHGEVPPFDPQVLSYEAFLSKGVDVPDVRVTERMHALEPSGLACLIYTSGTTGPPKAVMLTHRNLVFTSNVLANQIVAASPNDRVLSYLPLSHIAEQALSLHGPATAGYQVYFAESIEKVADNLKEVRPTVFFGVPRIWEKMDAAIGAKLAAAKGARKKLVSWAMKVGLDFERARGLGGTPDRMLFAQHTLAKRLVYDKLRQAIGLDQARFCVSGAAPISPDVLERFAGLGLPIYEVYGQSEDCGPTSINVPGGCKLGTVGRPLPGVEVKIAGDGEILVRAPHVFAGYLKDPVATAETVIDGYLHTGDLGAFDADGFLMITGRKKEILITAGGKNITPKNIEAALKEHVLVGEAVVIGDRRKFLSALLILDPEAAARFAAERGLKLENIHQHKDLFQELQRAVDRANQDLARVEQIKKFTVLAKPLSIEGGELTPTLKIKRRVIYEKYANEIESMYVE